MTDADAFLRACLAAPGDAAPRLVFADWLEEHGLHELGACPLRVSGYWWVVPDQTRCQVASVVYWRVPGATRVLTRLGSVADVRVRCETGERYLFHTHSPAMTWLGAVAGWACGAHVPPAGAGDLWNIANAVLAVEAAFIGNRGRTKRLTSART